MEAVSISDITLWKPEANVILHQALGKLAEETGELQQIVARCLIQGISASDPKTGQINHERLQEEISDVVAAIRWLRSIGFLRVDSPREDRKLAGFRRWERMLEADLSIAAGAIRNRIFALIEARTRIERKTLEAQLDDPMIEMGFSEDHKIDLSADIWVSMQVPINIAIDLKEDATIEDLIHEVERRVRKLAEAI
ncbi:hypothetical protein [Rhizobium tropici]|uniref:hypothetical protein n=1 Tax=Rhizobium tropici TaxID=398 RepID=UPI0015EBC156|nr:hypothetical protein [Rhizobium tropici]